MPTPTITRRERILNALVNVMKNMEDGRPTTDPYSVTWDVVTRGPIEGIHERKRYALSIIDQEESKDPIIGQSVVTLRVVLEFRVYLDVNEEASIVVNRVLGDVQRRIREDIYLTQDDGEQLSLNLVESGNQVFIDGYADKQVGGAVFVNILYKHAIDDPRLYVGNSRMGA